MKLFKSKKSSTAATLKFDPNEGPITYQQCLTRSVPFLYVSDTPAVNLSKFDSTRISMVKRPYDAATEALRAAELLGVRFQVIVMLDGSSSMASLYSNGQVRDFLINILGFALNIDDDGSIPVIPYGTDVGEIIEISIDDYQDVASSVKLLGGCTNMAKAYETAQALARATQIPAMIINVTDGNPYDGYSEQKAKMLMTNSVIRASGEPILLKNISLKKVPFLDALDDEPSRYEVKKDRNGKPVYTDGGQVVLEPNPRGLRLIDNVDSQSIVPSEATIKDWARVLTEEVSDFLDASGQVGTITGIPGVVRHIFA